jgi:hypothetical protein
MHEGSTVGMTGYDVSTEQQALGGYQNNLEARLQRTTCTCHQPSVSNPTHASAAC